MTTLHAGRGGAADREVAGSQPALDYYLIHPQRLDGVPASRPEGIVVEEFVLDEDFSAVGLHSESWGNMPKCDSLWAGSAMGVSMASIPAARETLLPPFFWSLHNAGWEDLARQASSNLRRAYDVIRANPRAMTTPERHHRLKGLLASGLWKGQTHERWQYEVTGGGRIWYLIDDERRTVWITYAGSGHPQETD